MSRRGTAEEKTAKSDPIYRNRLVNMLVNRILKHGKNHWLIKKRSIFNARSKNISLRGTCVKHSMVWVFSMSID
ncbi:hypothetical protein ACHQM5_021107 [Ranunculus cassubicifolius]